MIKKIILIGLGLILLVGGFLAYSLFRSSVRVNNKEDDYFYISTGDDITAVRKNLVEQHFISGRGFSLASKIIGYKKAKPGRYKLTQGMSIYKLVKMLHNGTQADVKMVINKERTKELFAGKVGKSKKYDFECDSLQMIHFMNNNDSLSRYGVDSNTIMALVMPYTYSLKWNSGPEKIFRQLYTAYRQFWTKERKTRADSLKLTPLQVSILASIVEEETNRKEDRYNIASTYLNRLRAGMKLQADPTIKFALRDFSLKRITGSLLQTDSPYNTYLYAGLPPGPICTPSLESIEAVLNAPPTDYLFFVASYKFDGSTVFTSNISDHMKNARLYQQELTRRMDSAKKVNTPK